MAWEKSVFVRLIAGVLLSAGAVAQVPVPRSPGTTGSVPTTGHPRQEPCWQVAGISKATMQQRRLVTEHARQQVEEVCANASLSLAQKREEIRQIHERERQELEGLITPVQQETLRACQQERGHVGAPHPSRAHGEGPCGELAIPQHRHPAEDEENEKPAPDEQKPN